jgi:O-succinylbenzoic acid--CoA ligase
MPVHTISGVEQWLDLAAHRRPDAAAVITPAESVTYRQLGDRAGDWARRLAALGVGPGDRVATTLPPGADFAALLHAVPKLSAVLVPVNTRLTGYEREALLADAKPALIVGEPLTGAAPDIELRGDFDSDDPWVVIYTSGTTGRPKGVELTHGNFFMSALGNEANLGSRPDDRWLCVLPVFHIGGLSILTRSAIYRTAAVVHPGFDVDAVKASLRDDGVTLVSLVATQLRRLLDAGLRRPPSLRAALIGGGPVPRDLLARAEEAGIPVVPTYGMTETCSQVWTGRPLPDAEIRTADDGEILVRGPMVAPKELSEDGWLHTGDRGSIDPGGALHVEGRIADTIVTGGENVAAAEVEEALLSHPGVQDAAVVGRPDPEWGQAVVAYVVAKGVDDGELIAHCRRLLAGYKVPKVIERIGEIPRNAAGKIVRGRLA